MSTTNAAAVPTSSVVSGMPSADPTTAAAETSSLVSGIPSTGDLTTAAAPTSHDKPDIPSTGDPIAPAAQPPSVVPVIPSAGDLNTTAAQTPSTDDPIAAAAQPPSVVPDIPSAGDLTTVSAQTSSVVSGIPSTGDLTISAAQTPAIVLDIPSSGDLTTVSAQTSSVVPGIPPTSDLTISAAQTPSVVPDISSAEHMTTATAQTPSVVPGIPSISDSITVAAQAPSLVPGIPSAGDPTAAASQASSAVPGTSSAGDPTAAASQASLTGYMQDMSVLSREEITVAWINPPSSAVPDNCDSKLEQMSMPQPDKPEIGLKTWHLFDAREPGAVVTRDLGYWPINVNIYAKEQPIRYTQSSAVQNEIDCLEHFRAVSRALFVSTDAFVESAALFDEEHLLVITGGPGMGKSFNSMQLLLHVCDENQCSPFQPTVPEEYLQWYNTREKQAFLMDDLFGSSTLNQAKYEAWKNVCPKMIHHLKSKNIYLIFAIRENILKACLPDLMSTGLFNNVINLSDEKFSLTTTNKTDIFLSHANKFNIDIQYEELTNVQSVGGDPIGLPQRVHLFCSMVNVSKEARMRYFNSAMEYLSTLLESYRVGDKAAYCVLVLLLLHDGQLPVSILKHSNKSSAQVQRCLEICDIPTSTIGSLRNKADSLCNSLLLFANDIYMYHHPTVMEAVTLDFGQRYPSDILNCCSVHFLLERVFTTKSSPPDNEYVVIIQPVMFPLLCDRLVKEIASCIDKRNSLKPLCSYAVFNDTVFTNVFLCHLQDTASLYLLLTSSSSDSQHPTFLFFAAASGQKALVREALFFSDVQQLPGFREHLDRILYAACYSGSPAVVRALLAAGACAEYRTGQAPDNVRYDWWWLTATFTTLMHAAYSGSPEVMQLIFDRLQQQRVNVAELLCISDGEGRTTLMHAVYSGCAEVLQLTIDRLQQHRVDLTEHFGIRDGEGRMVLHWWAVGRRRVNVLQILLKAGADIDARDADGRTALYWSVRRGDEAAVCALLKAGADVHISSTKDKGLPLESAARHHHAAIVDILLDRMIDDLDRWSPQILVEYLVTKDSAPSDNNYAIVQQPEKFAQLCAKLVREIRRCVCVDEEGENVTSCSDGNSSYSEADSSYSCVIASFKLPDPYDLRSLSTYRVFRDPAFLRVFLRHLQDTNALHILLVSSSPHSSHPTFLFFAAESGQDALVNGVLSSRDVQQVSGFKDHLDRVLYAACYSGSSATVLVLLAAGAQVDYRTAHDPDDVRRNRWWEPATCTVLQHAIYCSSSEILRLVLDSLQQQRVDVAESLRIRDGDGRTALHWWLRGEQGADALQILLDARADVHAGDAHGQTALYWSAERGNEAAVRTLIEAGADVNLKDDKSWTALHRAAEEGHVAIVRLLLEAGADVNSKDDKGCTVLHCAAELGHAVTARLLVEAGADVHLRASASNWGRTYTDLTPLEIAVRRGRTDVTVFLRSHPSKLAA